MAKIIVRVYWENGEIEFQTMHPESCNFINYIDPIVRGLARPYKKIEIVPDIKAESIDEIMEAYDITSMYYNKKIGFDKIAKDWFKKNKFKEKDLIF